MESIQVLNQQYLIDREKYDDLKTQFDLCVQQESLFEMEETKMGDPLLKYKSEEGFQKQGIEMRFRFTDEIKTVLEKVKEVYDIKDQFAMYEICLDKNGYNRVLNSITSTGADTIEQANKILGDNKISH